MGAVTKALEVDSGSAAAAVNPVADSATALLTLVYLLAKCPDPSVMDLLVPNLHSVLATAGMLLGNALAVYTKEWLVMKMFQYEVTLQLLEFTAAHLNAGDAALSPHCDALFFSVGLTFLREETLDLASATMSTARRNLITSEYGDLRLKVSGVLATRWAGVDPARRSEAAMIDLMVSSLLDLVSSSCREVSGMAQAMFFDLLQAEFRATSNFFVIGSHAVQAIDDIMSKSATAAAGDGDLPLQVASNSPLARFPRTRLPPSP
jgi:hypothetical protein